MAGCGAAPPAAPPPLPPASLLASAACCLDKLDNCDPPPPSEAEWSPIEGIEPLCVGDGDEVGRTALPNANRPNGARVAMNSAITATAMSMRICRAGLSKVEVRFPTRLKPTPKRKKTSTCALSIPIHSATSLKPLDRVLGLMIHTHTHTTATVE